MEAHRIDLSRLDLPSGGGRRIDTDVHLPAIEIGGERYAVLEVPTEVRLDVSRTSSGWAVRLRFELAVSGRCARCLKDVSTELAVDAREVEATAAADEELHSPYVSEDVLDLDSWARDSLTLSIPAKYLCRADCPGLCAVCGEPLADADAQAHSHEEGGDPRWAALRNLEIE